MSDEMRHICHLPAYVSVLHGVYKNIVAHSEPNRPISTHQDKSQIFSTFKQEKDNIVNKQEYNIKQEEMEQLKQLQDENQVEQVCDIGHFNYISNTLNNSDLIKNDNHVHPLRTIHYTSAELSASEKLTTPNETLTPVSHKLESSEETNSSNSDDNLENTANSSSYDRALELLNTMIAHASKRSVDNLAVTRRLVHALGLQAAMEKMKFVHIAGTKGKGTTAVYTSALLHSYGYRVGLFTSPHLIDVRERFLINNKILPKSKFAMYFFEMYDKWQDLQNSESELTRFCVANFNYFRFLFLLSLYIFNAEEVEVAVVEVGLGGRIDATNVIPSSVSVITALGYDHVEVLGSTINEIAHEKAGIIKAHVPCFASPQKDHSEARDVLTQSATAAPAQLLFIDDDVFPLFEWPTLAIGGEHAIEDSKLAFLAARYIASIPVALPLTSTERATLASLTFTGRSQIYSLQYANTKIKFYLDGAHTPESLSRALAWFKSSSSSSVLSPNVLLFYTSRNPKVVLKSFTNYISLFCKTVIAQIHNPRVIITNSKDTETSTTNQHNGSSSSSNIESNTTSTEPTEVKENTYSVNRIKDQAMLTHQHMMQTVEAWQELFLTVPCVAYPHPLTSLHELLNVALSSISDEKPTDTIAIIENNATQNSSSNNVSNKMLCNTSLSPSSSSTTRVNIFVCGSFYLIGDVLRIIREYEMGKDC